MLWLCQQRLVIVLMKQPLLLQTGTEECVACLAQNGHLHDCVQVYLLEPSLQPAEVETEAYSTAQHSTAQHSTAQRVAGQKLTAPDN